MQKTATTTTTTNTGKYPIKHFFSNITGSHPVPLLEKDLIEWVFLKILPNSSEELF